MKKILISFLLLGLLSGFFVLSPTKAASAYDYQFITQAPYPPLPPGAGWTLWIEIKNIGTATWTSDVVHLGTSSPLDRKSVFQSSDWLSNNRVTPFDPHYAVNGKLPPGYHSRFTFNIIAPSTPGTYREYFRPVADGFTWMKDIGIYWDITVTDPNKPSVPAVSPVIPQTPTVQTPQLPDTQSLLNNFAPAIVRIICNLDGWSGDIYKGTGNTSQGSGTLTGDSISGFIVLTNLHVVKTNDDSLSKCNIALTKNPKDITSMVFFRSHSYKYKNDDLDFATITPEIITESGYIAGTLNDLNTYALSGKTPICGQANFTDKVFALGYPQGSGNLVTITSGVIVGFGYLPWDNSRYIKTNAFTDHGSSGGLAIKDTGCILGITSAGNGSMNYVLDFNYLLN